MARALVTFSPLQPSEPDHYATLGLDRRCSDAQIRAAYRVLAKQHHPDVNGGSQSAQARTQELNSAYEILSDPVRRKIYDEAMPRAKSSPRSARVANRRQNISQDVFLRVEDLLRGTSFNVRVNDPGNPSGAENYELTIPPMTAPGTRFRLPRAEGGFVVLRAKARPDFPFKIRGADLRCDLKISLQRATQGGSEKVRGATGNFLTVPIPRGVARGEIIRLAGEGLPRTRGGRGDLLVRIVYRPEVRLSRK